jgi:superfamily I DNA/RNA helicase
MSTYVAVFALVLAYVAFVAAYIALRTLAKLRRSTAVLARGARTETGYESLLEAAGRNAERTDLLSEQLTELRQLVTAPAQEPGEDVTGALRHVALVRYDAFSDLTGRMSFSLAMLDDDGNGVTLSAIAGRNDTRVYAKGVADGKGEHELSPEEQQAVVAASERRRGLLHRKSA